MKTSSAKKIEELNQQILDLEKELHADYDRLKDFKLSSNKTDIVLKRMSDTNSLIKSYRNKKYKLLNAT